MATAQEPKRLSVMRKGGVAGIHEVKRADGTSELRESRVYLDGRNGLSFQVGKRVVGNFRVTQNKKENA
jgi:hypothetical protein